MAKYKVIPGGVCAAKGFSASGVHAGFRANPNKLDLAIIKADVRCAAAGVYTTNKVYGAPIKVDRAHLVDGHAQAVLVNSGNANTCAANGVDLANECCALVAQQLGIAAEDVLPASTGVIGQKLPVEKGLDGVRQIIPAKLDKANGSDAAYAIMTTDTVRKESAYELELSSGTIRIGAMAKGSGMIHPNMATTLAYVTTDAKCDSADLQKMLHNAIDKSFNMCTVDGDTSTNDTMILLANGASGVEVKTEEDKAALAALIEHICMDMARRIASDGEGATHLIVVESYGLPTEHDARLVAKAIAGSTLFKAPV